MKILIVEHHHPSHRQLLRLTLEAGGYGVLEIPDGAQALQLLEREAVDAIISDILLLNLDGFRLCYEVRRSARWGQLPFIFHPATYTAHDPSPDEQLALKLGADVFLPQPAAPEAILAAVQTALKHAGRMAPSFALHTDTGAFREYSERLVARLEAKNRELASVNQELAESYSRFYGTLANVDLIAMTLDRNGRVTFCNDFLLRLTGWTRDEVIGHLWFSQFLPDSAESTKKLFFDHLDAGEIPQHHRNPIKTRTGDLRTIAWNNTVLRDGANQVIGTASIGEDVTDRERTEAALRNSATKLRALALRLEDVREQERTAVAREIHDVLAQDLTRLKIDLVWLAKRLASPVNETLRSTLVERVAAAVTQTDTAITHVQRIATDLRPLILDSLGLPAAVEWQVEDFGRRTGLACQARAPRGNLPLDNARATALFRILQECLTNIARHAKATTVEVQLVDEPGVVTLTVHDNGRGILATEIDNPRSVGLVGMCERAQAFGGTVQIAGAPGGGTTVTARISFEPALAP